jgi:hypothetical protein
MNETKIFLNTISFSWNNILNLSYWEKYFDLKYKFFFFLTTLKQPQKKYISDERRPNMIFKQFFYIVFIKSCILYNALL